MMEDEPPEPWMDVLDSTGNIVGSSRCYEDTSTEMERQSHTFILAATDPTLLGEEKFVMGIEQDGSSGMWLRQSAGRIGEEHWNRAERRTELIVLN